MDKSRFWILVICAAQAAFVASVIAWVALAGGGDGAAASADADSPARTQTSLEPNLAPDHSDY